MNLGQGSEGQKFADNIKAIETIKHIEADEQTNDAGSHFSADEAGAMGRGSWDAEPGPYDTLETWERYLNVVEAMDFAPDAIPSKASLLRSARETIAMKKRVEREIEGEARRANREYGQRQSPEPTIILSFPPQNRHWGSYFTAARCRGRAPAEVPRRKLGA
jgi:hypothetical protein